MDTNDSYYFTAVMEVLDEAEKDLSNEEFHALIEDLVQDFKEKTTP